MFFSSTLKMIFKINPSGLPEIVTKHFSAIGSNSETDRAERIKFFDAYFNLPQEKRNRVLALQNVNDIELMVKDLTDSRESFSDKKTKEKYKNEIEALQLELLARDAKVYMNSVGIKVYGNGKQVNFNDLFGSLNSVKEMSKLSNGHYQLTIRQPNFTRDFKFNIPIETIKQFARQYRDNQANQKAVEEYQIFVNLFHQPYPRNQDVAPFWNAFSKLTVDRQDQVLASKTIAELKAMTTYLSNHMSEMIKKEEGTGLVWLDNMKTKIENITEAKIMKGRENQALLFARDYLNQNRDVVNGFNHASISDRHRVVGIQSPQGDQFYRVIFNDTTGRYPAVNLFMEQEKIYNFARLQMFNVLNSSFDTGDTPDAKQARVSFVEAFLMVSPEVQETVLLKKPLNELIAIALSLSHRHTEAQDKQDDNRAEQLQSAMEQVKHYIQLFSTFDTGDALGAKQARIDFAEAFLTASLKTREVVLERKSLDELQMIAKSFSNRKEEAEYDQDSERVQKLESAIDTVNDHIRRRGETEYVSFHQ